MVKTHPFFKTTAREIRNSIGRFIAILIITALGVGFFSGLRLTEPSMTATADKFLTEQNLFDFRLLSTLGFTNDDVKAFDGVDGMKASGAYNLDFLGLCGSGNELILKAHSITDGINIPQVINGSMPESENECVVDANIAGSAPIGSVIKVADSNTQSAKDTLKYTEFTVVGHVRSPYYINFERGNSSVGTGSIAGFVYIPEAAFESEVYHEIFIDAPIEGKAFSSKYDDGASALSPKIESILNERGQIRFDDIYNEALSEINKNQAELDNAKLELEDGRAKLDDAITQYNEAKALYEQFKDFLTEEQKAEYLRQFQEAEKQIADGEKELKDAETKISDGQAAIDQGRADLEALTAPSLFVLGRDTNIGYACFENDSGIVSAISVVFPLLFMLVAILVCMTTMTRMVDENRVQIGVFKSLGYSNLKIQSKFLIYSGIAASAGWLGGYALGSYFVPRIIWNVYNIMYNFADLTYVFDPLLFLLCFAAAIGCACGSAYFACRAALQSVPAELIRPKAPKTGKKIFLERIGFLWKRFSFLHKVSARNIFRYKNRLFMMIIGIGGCTALLVTGFGIRDSIKNIVSFQFDEIMLYDYSANIDTENKEVYDKLIELDGIESGLGVYQTSASLKNKDERADAFLLSCNDPRFTDFIDLHEAKEPIPYPENGNAVISAGVAEILGISVGDSVTINIGETRETTFTVSGIFDNFFNNYVILTESDCESAVGKTVSPNTVFLKTIPDENSGDLAARISGVNGVTSVTSTSELIDRVSSSLNSIEYIVAFVVICAAALAFVVLYNLSNINIAERVREIATIKVLGFHKKEVSSYIFREIIALTFIGATIGLPLGKLLHSFVMHQIKVNTVHFDNRISVLSFLIAFTMTIVFAFIINIFMARRLDKIDMSGSLKSVE